MNNEQEMDEGAVRRRRRQKRRDGQKRKQRLALFLYFLLGLVMVVGMISIFFSQDLANLAGY